MAEGRRAEASRALISSLLSLISFSSLRHSNHLLREERIVNAMWHFKRISGRRDLLKIHRKIRFILFFLFNFQGPGAFRACFAYPSLDFSIILWKMNRREEARDVVWCVKGGIMSRDFNMCVVITHSDNILRPMSAEPYPSSIKWKAE